MHWEIAYHMYMRLAIMHQTTWCCTEQEPQYWSNSVPRLSPMIASRSCVVPDKASQMCSYGTLDSTMYLDVDTLDDTMPPASTGASLNSPSARGMACNSRGLAWNSLKLWIWHNHHHISLPSPRMALTWRSSCTLRGLQCENGLQNANFRVKCIFVVITRNTITSSKQHLQRLKRSQLKAI